MGDQKVPGASSGRDDVVVTLVDERGRTRHFVRADGTPIVDDHADGTPIADDSVAVDGSARD